MSYNFIFFRAKNMLARVIFKVVMAPFFQKCGKNSVVISADSVQGISNISLGNNVFIASGAVLAAVGLEKDASPRLSIGNRCTLGRNNHIYSTGDICLEDGVLTAANVYISDNQHQYTNTDKFILDQPVQQLRHVRIGAGSWLGQNVSVIGASVGKGCVIGANSVVLNDVPDYCVALGAPARVIRRFDHESGLWVRVTLQSRANFDNSDN